MTREKEKSKREKDQRGILMDVRSGQKAALEKAAKQKKNQVSTSQKSKKESSISKKGLPSLPLHLRCQPWPALPSVPQGTAPSICPEKENNFKGK